MSDLPDRDEVAVVVRGIELAVWSLSEVIAWADFYIDTASGAPPPWLIGCSLSRHVLDARHALLAVAAGSPLLEDDVLGLALIAERVTTGAITWREAIRIAYHLVLDRDMSGELANYVYYLDDAVDLAETRVHGSLQEAERDAVEFFGSQVQETASAGVLRAFLREHGRLLAGARGRRTRS